MDREILRERLREYETMSPFEIKDKLIKLAKESSRKSALTLLNAGRGNPNWVATTPREAFFLLGQFAIEECKRVMDQPDLGGMPQARALPTGSRRSCERHPEAPGAAAPAEMVPFAVQRFEFEPDAFVHELVDSIIGDNYPVPDRMLVHAERVVHEYLMWAMCDNKPPAGQIRPVCGRGRHGGDVLHLQVADAEPDPAQGRHRSRWALPIFTPYIEMPHLNDYEFDVVHGVRPRRTASSSPTTS